MDMDESLGFQRSPITVSDHCSERMDRAEACQKKL